MRIYLATSWRNPFYGEVLKTLRLHNHKVYDFKNPMHGTQGFHLSHIGLDCKLCTADECRRAIQTNPLAAQGYMSDMRAMEWADACVMLLPSGRSAHLEAGWFAGRGKLLVIYTRDGEEPELMALMAHHICISMSEVLEALS